RITTASAEGDDGRDGCCRPAAHHVVDANRSGSHEAFGDSCPRRNGEFTSARLDCHTCNLHRNSRKGITKEVSRELRESRQLIRVIRVIRGLSSSSVRRFAFAGMSVFYLQREAIPL